MSIEISQDDWPRIELLRVDSRQSAQWSKYSEAVPIFSRRPYGDWCLFFTGLCEDDQEIDWKDAGFALCLPEDMKKVTDKFSEAVDEANEEFRAFLGRGLINDDKLENARQVRDLILLEGSAAAGEDLGGSPCGSS
jgi:hypothetical protein